MATFWVNAATGQDGTGGHDGTGPSKAWLTFAYAMANSPSGSTVLFAAGTYNVGSTGATGFDLGNKSLTLDVDPLNPGTVIIERYNGSSTRVLKWSPTTAGHKLTIRGLTPDCGGTAGTALYCAPTVFSELELEDTKFKDFLDLGVIVAGNVNLRGRDISFSSLSMTGSNSWGLSYTQTTPYANTVDIDGVVVALRSSNAVSGVRGVYVSGGNGSSAPLLSTSVKNVVGSVTATGAGANAGSTGVLVLNSRGPAADGGPLVRGVLVTVGQSDPLSASQGVSIFGNGANGDASGACVELCDIIHNAHGGYGVIIGSAASGVTAGKAGNGTIRYNRVTGMGGAITPHGLSIANSTGGQVYGNIVDRFYVSLHAHKQTGGMLYNNIVLRPYGRDLYSQGTNGTKWFNNTIILLAGDPDKYVPTSTPHGFLACNKSVDGTVDSVNPEFRNNLIYCEKPLARMTFMAVSTNTGVFSNNCYCAKAGLAADAFYYGATTYSSLAAWQAAHDSGSIDADPALGADYGPRASILKLLGANLTASGITDDYSGKPRPSAGPWCIGARQRKLGGFRRDPFGREAFKGGFAA